MLLFSFALASPAPAAESGKDRGAALFTNYDSESFRKLKAAQERIDPRQINKVLLDAAVFHETNRRREGHELSRLAYNEAARKTARMQSEAMAKHGFVGHINPKDAEKRTFDDRARLAGLRPALLAENVASTFGRQYQAGDKFFIREEGGRKIYSTTPDGPPIPMHTYVSFAEALLAGWMESPGHRENILRNGVEFLGCACEPSSTETEMEKFYCTQIFFTPLR